MKVFLHPHRPPPSPQAPRPHRHQNRRIIYPANQKHIFQTNSVHVHCGQPEVHRAACRRHGWCEKSAKYLYSNVRTIGGVFKMRSYGTLFLFLSCLWIQIFFDSKNILRYSTKTLPQMPPQWANSQLPPKGTLLLFTIWKVWVDVSNLYKMV